MVAEYINKIGVQNTDGTYSYKDIGADSDHIEVDATGKTLTTKITELENKVPNPATESVAGIVKPGTGMSVEEDGTLDLTYDHSLTLTKEDGTVIDTFNGSADKTISVATIPTDHSSPNTTYGVATTAKFGHVKTVDTYSTEPGATNGTVASATALYNAYTELKRGTGVELTQDTYDALSDDEKKNGSSYYVNDSYDGALDSKNVYYDNSTSGLTASYVNTAIDELAAKSYKPLPHSSLDTSYGSASSTEYGHAKLSDVWKTSDGNADSGVAASSYALNAAYNELNSNFSTINTKLQQIPNLNGTTLGASSSSYTYTTTTGHKGFFLTAGGSDARMCAILSWVNADGTALCISNNSNVTIARSGANITVGAGGSFLCIVFDLGTF